MPSWKCSRHIRLYLAGLGGLLMGWTLIFPAALGWLEWLVPGLAVPLLWHLSEEGEYTKRYRRAWLGGFAFFLPFYLVTFHWFVALYPLSFTDFSPWLAALVVSVAWCGLSLFQSVGMAWIFVIIVALWRCPIIHRHPLSRPWIAAAVFTVGEWVQTLGWFGVPWGRFSLGQAVYLPLLQTASLFGCYGITFLLVAVGFALGQIVMTPASGRRALCLLAVGLFTGNLAVGSALYVITEQQVPKATLTSGTVQGNFSTLSKWDMTISGTMSVYRDHIESLIEKDVDLILLPETALPFLLQDYPKYQHQLSELAKRGEMTLFVGTFTQDAEHEYSSVVTYHANGSVDEAIYHKQRLVPFGEFVPMKALITTLIPPLANLNMWESDLGAGNGSVSVTDLNGTYGFLICFDSIYESLARARVKAGAELILLPTNDSWFLDSAAVRMHRNQARLRAIECGRSVVRAANTGISVLITPTGRVTAQIPPLVEDTMCGEVSLYTHTTMYVLLGNWFVGACAVPPLLLLSGKFGLCVRRRLDKKRGTCYNDDNIDRD